MKIFLIAGFTILALGSSISTADTSKNDLSGVLNKSVKSSSPYVLKLDGQTGTFDLRGDKLRSIKPGTRVWVSGQLRTELVRSSRQPAFPTQWHVYMEVVEVTRTQKAFERSDETGGSVAHMEPSLSIEFKITIIFLTQAMIATFFGFPDATNR